MQQNNYLMAKLMANPIYNVWVYSELYEFSSVHLICQTFGQSLVSEARQLLMAVFYHRL